MLYLALAYTYVYDRRLNGLLGHSPKTSVQKGKGDVCELKWTGKGVCVGGEGADINRRCTSEEKETLH